jgi:acetolactate synthase-1/2/3 large subunit
MIYVELNNRVRQAADVVLTLGSRLGETDWWGKAPYWRKPAEQKMIQVDIDEETLGCNKPAELTVLADAGEFLEALASELRDRAAGINRDERNAFLEQIREQKEAQREELNMALTEDIDPMNPAHVGSICRKVFPDDAISVFDGGNAAVWGNFYSEVRVANTQLSTHKFGMLGAGVAQALGAAAAFPDRQVYCIIGDGAMGFHPQEVETAVRNNLKPIYLVLCDRQWGMVKMSQQFALSQTKPGFGPEDIVNADFHEIRFDKLAESMGAYGTRVSRAAELGPAIEAAQASGRCAVIHVDVDPEKHMWAPGLMHFKEMHAEPSGE